MQPNSSLCNYETSQASSMEEEFPFHVIVIAIFLALLNLWTIIGNLTVGLALLRFESLRRISNYLIGNLALSDFLLSVTVLPFSMTSDLLGHWVFGEVMCKIWLAIDVLYCTASIWNICAIAFDRFTATTFPLWYRERRSGSTALIYIAIVWIWSFLISVPPIVLSQSSFNETYSKINNSDNYMCKLYDQQWYVLYSATGSFILPIGILTILYAKIFVVLHQQSRTKQRKRLNAAATVTMLSASQVQQTCEVSTQLSQLAHSSNNAPLPEFDHVESTDSLQIDNQQRRGDSGDSALESEEWRDKVSADLMFGNNMRRNISDKPGRTGGSLTESIFIRHLSGRLSASPASGMFRQILLRQHQRHVSISEHTPTTRNRTMSYDSAAAQAFHYSEGEDSKVSSTHNSLLLLQSRVPGFLRRTTATASTRRRQSLKRFTRREAEATRKCLYIIIAFLIAWMPFLVTYLLRGMANLWVHPYVMTAIIWCGYASSAINPCLYALYNEEFRQAFRKILVQAALCKKFVM